MRLVAKRSTVKQAGGWESYLRQEYGLLEGVELTDIKHEGMYGNVYYHFDTPEGEIKCAGYISSGLVRTWKMNVTTEEERRAFFGFEEYDRLKRLKREATTGLND